MTNVINGARRHGACRRRAAARVRRRGRAGSAVGIRGGCRRAVIRGLRAAGGVRRALGLARRARGLRLLDHGGLIVGRGRPELGPDAGALGREAHDDGVGDDGDEGDGDCDDRGGENRLALATLPDGVTHVGGSDGRTGLHDRLRGRVDGRGLGARCNGGLVRA